MVTTLRPGGNGITLLPGRRVSPDRLIDGPRAWALSISTASMRVKPINSCRAFTRIRRRSRFTTRKPMLTQDLTDRAIAWMRLQKSVTPTKPFSSTGRPAPHMPLTMFKRSGRTASKASSIRVGISSARRFSQGKKKLGVIPAEAKLTPRPPQIPSWDSMSAEHKKIGSRLMEIYAGFLAQTDYEIGRMVEAIKDTASGTTPCSSTSLAITARAVKVPFMVFSTRCRC